jgi:N-acetylneuraminate synthase/N,N'-diacetyllegionaminate synthase
LELIKIRDKVIGTGQPCFIIAEAGVNHNGQLKLAKKLVDAAVTAGADAVKFQTFIAEGVVSADAKIADYAKKNIGNDMKQIDMLKNCELNYDEFILLKEYCDKKNIIFLSTPHSFDAIDFLEDLVPAYKFSSGDLTNIPALQYAAKKGKPMILGTGMATLEEVRQAINAITSIGNTHIIVLHCTTNYPCLLEDVNLRAMQTIQQELDCLVGYSDHTLGLLVPPLAVALGATILEKHFTLDKKLPGPDHTASLVPNELTQMIRKIKEAEKILGKSEKKPTESEKTIMTMVRKSIVAGKNFKKGEVIQKEMLMIKRPGTGISPADIEKIIGKKTKQAITIDEILHWDMVE